jgi:ribosomal protein S18 acetylase RimI-like enzyme
MSSLHPNSIRVRPCARPDLPQVSSIEIECFPADALPLLSLVQYFDLFPSTFLVAIDQDSVVGFAIAGVSAESPREAWVLDIAVRPSHRRSHVGTALMAALARILKTLGVTSVRATVAPTNTASRRLCTRAGFRVEGEDPNYFGPNEPRLLLRLTWAE